MTATATPTVNTRGSFARLPAAFRLQFSVRGAMIGVPIIVFFGSWAIALGIGMWIHFGANMTESDPPMYTGASQATLWTLGFMAAYAASHTFAFSMALSYSRRIFLLGAVGAFAAISAAFGVAFALGALLERATGGFGIRMFTFDLPYLTDGPGGVVATGLFATLLCLSIMLFGFLVAMAYRRLKLIVLWTIALVVVAALALGAVGLAQAGLWGDVWAWMVDQTALSLSAYFVLVIAFLTGLNYVVIRRATPS